MWSALEYALSLLLPPILFFFFGMQEDFDITARHEMGLWKIPFPLFPRKWSWEGKLLPTMDS